MSLQIHFSVHLVLYKTKCVTCGLQIHVGRELICGNTFIYYSHLLLHYYLNFIPSLTTPEICLTSACSSCSSELCEEEHDTFLLIFAQDEIILTGGNARLFFPFPGVPDSCCCTGCTPLCWREARWVRVMRWKAKAMLFLQPGRFSLH